MKLPGENQKKLLVPDHTYTYFYLNSPNDPAIAIYKTTFDVLSEKSTAGLSIAFFAGISDV